MLFQFWQIGGFDNKKCGNSTIKDNVHILTFFWGHSYSLWLYGNFMGKVITFGGSITTLGWPLYAISNPPKHWTRSKAPLPPMTMPRFWRCLLLNNIPLLHKTHRLQVVLVFFANLRSYQYHSPLYRWKFWKFTSEHWHTQCTAVIRCTRASMRHYRGTIEAQ